MSSNVQITKASGDLEDFNEEKLFRSLIFSGLSPALAHQTLDHVKKHLIPGVSTGNIHELTSNFLKDTASRRVYFNYNLKRAIMALGPSGHPFETIVGDLLHLYHFDTEVSVILNGRCITHEIDVVAKKDKDQYFIECKFHNQPGTKSDAQVALYTYARFQDLNDNHQLDQSFKNMPWLITNTKATSDAIKYAECQNMRLTTWGYPQNHGLMQLITDVRLHPITCLDHIPRHKMEQLISRNLVTCARLKNAIDNNLVDDILNDDEKSHFLDDITQIIASNDR